MTPEIMKKLEEYLEEKTARVAHIIPMSMSFDCEAACPILEELIDETDDDELEKLFGKKATGLCRDELDQGERRIAILEAMVGIKGFLVEIQVAHRWKEDKWTRITWGGYTHLPMYTKEIDEDFFERVKKEVDQVIKLDLERPPVSAESDW